MTDAFEVTGEFAPAENFSTPLNTTLEVVSSVEATAEVAADVPEAPKGFVELGLARELVMAV